MAKASPSSGTRSSLRGNDDLLPCAEAERVCREFVMRYYALLNEDPLHLHRRFYSQTSHDGLNKRDQNDHPVCGQQDVYLKLLDLGSWQCSVDILRVTCLSMPGSGLVVQVKGKINSNGEWRPKRFTQAFLLAPKCDERCEEHFKRYTILSDIFRYQPHKDELFVFDEEEEEAGVTYSDEEEDATEGGVVLSNKEAGKVAVSFNLDRKPRVVLPVDEEPFDSSDEEEGGVAYSDAEEDLEDCDAVDGVFVLSDEEGDDAALSFRRGEKPQAGLSTKKAQFLHVTEVRDYPDCRLGKPFHSIKTNKLPQDLRQEIEHAISSKMLQQLKLKTNLMDLPATDRRSELRSLETGLRSMNHYSFMCLERHLNGLTSMAKVEQLISECKNLEYFHCIVFIAVVVGRGQLLDSQRLETRIPWMKSRRDNPGRPLCWEFHDMIITFVKLRKLWSCVLRFVKSTEVSVCKEMISLYCELLSEEDKTEFYRAVEEMGDVDLLKSWFLVSTVNGCFHSLKLMVYSKNEIVQQAVREVLQASPDCLLTPVEYVCHWRLTNEDAEPNVDFKCLYLFCQAGLFEGFVQKGTKGTPLGKAVFYNQPDLVRLLYNAGAAVSNSEVLHLSQDPTLEKRCQANRRKAQPSHSRPSSPAAKSYPTTDDKDAAIEIKEFLSSKASLPSSLQDLCLREVAKHVGWGYDRDRRVEQLEIDVGLTKMLTYKDDRLIKKK